MVSRCHSCNLRLVSFDDLELWKKGIRLSNVQQTLYVDPQHKLITDTKEGCVITVMKGVRD